MFPTCNCIASVNVSWFCYQTLCFKTTDYIGQQKNLLVIGNFYQCKYADSENPTLKYQINGGGPNKKEVGKSSEI